MATPLNAAIHVLKHGKEQVTSYYGIRTDPVTGKVLTRHLGIDLINTTKNETVVAFADGTVTATRNTYTGPTTDGSAGNYVRILHASGCYTLYKHLKQDTLRVKAGDAVTAGQALATMGDTGHTTGVHLHFDVERNGVRVDPLPYLTGQAVLPGPRRLFGNRGDKPTVTWGTKTHPDILALQQWLNANRSARILADGIAGNRTLAYAQKYTVKNGTDGAVPQWVQRRLTSLGYYTGLVDGEPRSLTEKAIRALETDFGLTVDGKVSGNDWYYLLAVE